MCLNNGNPKRIRDPESRNFISDPWSGFRIWKSRWIGIPLGTSVYIFAHMDLIGFNNDLDQSRINYTISVWPV
jgi:hypothetical protein